MIERIEKELRTRLDSCKDKFFPRVDLTMKNGDYVSIGFPSTWKWGSEKFTVITEDDDIIKFNDLKSVAGWIVENYC